MPELLVQKISVDFTSFKGKQKVNGLDVYYFAIECRSSGEVIQKKTGPYRDETEADNAALDLIDKNSDIWEF